MAVTVLTSACSVAAYNVVGGPLLFGLPWWMLLVCAICVYFGLWWTYVHFDPERKEIDMTEASVQVYVVQPFSRFDEHRHPLKAGWWWSVTVDGPLAGRSPVSDTAWAPDRDSAWNAALERAAELKDAAYA